MAAVTVLVSGSGADLTVEVVLSTVEVSIAAPALDVNVGTGLPGPVGAQGSDGADGAQGAQGPQGDAGGPQGPQGDAGPQGPQGDVGAQGAQGATGAAGPQGDTGAAGPQGTQGDTGAAGPQGAQGSVGAQGNQGFQGETGAAGPQGTQGETGAAGPQGTQGFQGATGAQGNQGFQGDVGATGPQGTQGFQGTTGATGAQGTQGFQGTTGATGPQGTQGFQGTTGATGAQGAQGAVGAQGAQGDEGLGFTWEDVWSDASVSYAINDVVTHLGELWVCITAHTSSGAEEPGVGAKWEQMVASAQPDYIDVYDTTGGQDLGAGVGITMDTVRGSSGNTFSHAAGVITIGRDVLARIHFKLGTDIDVITRVAGQGHLELDTGGGYVEIAGTKLETYNRVVGDAPGTTASGCIVLSLSAGDKVRLFAAAATGSTTDCDTKADGSSLLFEDAKSGISNAGEAALGTFRTRNNATTTTLVSTGYTDLPIHADNYDNGGIASRSSPDVNIDRAGSYLVTFQVTVRGLGTLSGPTRYSLLPFHNVGDDTVLGEQVDDTVDTDEYVTKTFHSMLLDVGTSETIKVAGRHYTGAEDNDIEVIGFQTVIFVQRLPGG